MSHVEFKDLPMSNIFTENFCKFDFPLKPGDEVACHGEQIRLKYYAGMLLIEF